MISIDVDRLTPSEENDLLRPAAFFLLFVIAAGPVRGEDKFYERLYARGMTDFNTADYKLALDELHKAAFGFVDNIEKFETAEIYAAIAANRIGNQSATRDALLRIAAAENIEARFAAITIPDALRQELFRAAALLLTKKEATALGVPEQIQDAASKKKPRVVVPTPSKRLNVAETAPRDAGNSSAPVPNAELPPAASQTPAPLPATDPSPAGSVAPSSLPAPTDPTPAVSQDNRTIQPGAGTLQTTIPMMPPVPQPAQEAVEARLAEAQQAADDGKPDVARSIYDALLRGPRLSHPQALRLIEGMFRVRDFAGTTRAFRKAEAIGPGEERFHYYYAVALFETGHRRDARRELALALPFIEMTESVASYRDKISRAAK